MKDQLSLALIPVGAWSAAMVLDLPGPWSSGDLGWQWNPSQSALWDPGVQPIQLFDLPFVF